ncbi:MAG: hypothetical protein ABTA16_12435 [Niallia sp.]
MIDMVEVYLKNGSKVTLHEKFDDLFHVANTLNDETQDVWYYYENRYGSGAFLRSEVANFVILK